MFYIKMKQQHVFMSIIKWIGILLFLSNSIF